MINFDQYNKALRDYRINLEFTTTDSIFDFVDNDKDGVIIYDDLIETLKTPLSQERLNIINYVFN